MPQRPRLQKAVREDIEASAAPHACSAQDWEKLQTFQTKIMRKITPHPSSSAVRDGGAKENRGRRFTLKASRSSPQVRAVSHSAAGSRRYNETLGPL